MTVFPLVWCREGDIVMNLFCPQTDPPELDFKDVPVVEVKSPQPPVEPPEPLLLVTNVMESLLTENSTLEP